MRIMFLLGSGPPDQPTNGVTFKPMLVSAGSATAAQVFRTSRPAQCKQRCRNSPHWASYCGLAQRNDNSSNLLASFSVAGIRRAFVKDHHDVRTQSRCTASQFSRVQPPPGEPSQRRAENHAFLVIFLLVSPKLKHLKIRPEVSRIGLATG